VEEKLYLCEKSVFEKAAFYITFMREDILNVNGKISGNKIIIPVIHRIFSQANFRRRLEEK